MFEFMNYQRSEVSYNISIISIIIKHNSPDLTTNSKEQDHRSVNNSVHLLS